MSDIPDLVSPSMMTIIDSAQVIADKINCRHRERMADVLFSLTEARSERDHLQAERNAYAEKIERLQPELDNAHQTIAKLQLDVGILNGRLIERTEAMGERQREYLDPARSAESVAREAIAKFEELAAGFRETAADGALNKRTRGDSAAIARMLGEYADYLREKLEGGAA